MGYGVIVCVCVFAEWAKSLNQITFNGPFNKAIRVKWFVASSVNTASASCWCQC